MLYPRPSFVALFVALLLLWLTCPSSTLFAQASEPSSDSTFEGEIEVLEASVDVLVTSRRGDVPIDLGPADFEMEEDGERVEITGVEYVPLAYPEDETNLDAPPASRFFLLFFHDPAAGTSDPAERQRALTSARRDTVRWIRDGLGPADWVAVVRYDTSFHLLADWIQDREALIAAVEHGTSAEAGDPFRPSTRRRIETRRSFTLFHGLPHSFDLPHETLSLDDCLAGVAAGMGPIVGRKNLVLFTFGTPELMVGRRPDAGRYEPMIEALNAHDVAVYPVDLGETADEAVYDDLANTLASDTGGAYFDLSPSFFATLERIDEDTGGARFVVTFRPNRPAAGGYRELEVDVEGRGLCARARRGYVLEPR